MFHAILGNKNHSCPSSKEVSSIIRSFIAVIQEPILFRSIHFWSVLNCEPSNCQYKCMHNEICWGEKCEWSHITSWRPWRKKHLWVPNETSANWLLTDRECSHQILHLTASKTYTASTFEYIAASQYIHTLVVYWRKLFVVVVQTAKGEGLLVVGNKSS